MNPSAKLDGSGCHAIVMELLSELHSSGINTGGSGAVIENINV